MSIKDYIAKKFGQDVANQITQIFDFNQNLTWFDKNTNCTLTNDQYNILVINEAFNDWQENKQTYLENYQNKQDQIKIQTDLIKSYLESEEDFRAINN